MGFDFVVVGAGPAGASFAYFASRRGYSVAVYDQAPWPAFKACGWAVPRQIEAVIDIPSEVILTDIRGFRIYLDNRLIHEKYGAKWGYIIDKRAFLESLLTDSTLFAKRHVRIDRAKLRILGDTVRPMRGYIIAAGSASFPQKERIYAVQAILRVDKPVEEDTVEFWFTRSLIGYYWVFPRGRSVVDVGVGGYAKPGELVMMLEEFIRRRFSSNAHRIEGPKGSWINVGGVDEEVFNSMPPVIGEAAGFVYPLTGEGIRPSIVSAYTAIRKVEGEPPPAIYSQTIRWITMQRQILDIVKRSDSETRVKILERLPIDIFIGIGVGELSPLQLLRALPALPSSIATILKASLRKK